MGTIYLLTRNGRKNVQSVMGCLSSSDKCNTLVVPYRKKNYYIELLGWGEDIVVERKPQKKTKNDESK